MDTIRAARELGKALQADPIFLELTEISNRNDADEELKAMFESFRKTREEGKAELAKEKPDRDKVIEYNDKLSKAYAALMEQPGMIAYQEKKKEFQKLMQFVQQIIDESIDGKDPDTIEMPKEAPADAACSHDCSTCSSKCGA